MKNCSFFFSLFSLKDPEWIRSDWWTYSGKTRTFYSVENWSRLESKYGFTFFIKNKVNTIRESISNDQTLKSRIKASPSVFLINLNDGILDRLLFIFILNQLSWFSWWFLCERQLINSLLLLELILQILLNLLKILSLLNYSFVFLLIIELTELFFIIWV